MGDGRKIDSSLSRVIPGGGTRPTPVKGVLFKFDGDDDACPNELEEDRNSTRGAKRAA